MLNNVSKSLKEKNELVDIKHKLYHRPQCTLDENKEAYAIGSTKLS